MGLTEEQQKLWDTGVSLLRDGRLEEAQTAFDQLADLLPSSAPAWASKANNLNHLHRNEDALAAIDHALSLDASLGLGWCIRGDALSALLRFDEAAMAYIKALPLRVDKTAPLTGAVRALVSSERHAAALPMIDQLEQVTSDKELVWHYRATAYYGLGRYDEAVEAIEKALALGAGEREFDARIVQGSAHAYLGHNEEALAAYEQAIRLRPKDMRGWEGKLWLLRRTRRWRALWQGFKEMLVAKPSRQVSV